MVHSGKLTTLDRLGLYAIEWKTPFSGGQFPPAEGDHENVLFY
jgi:hypothetical protein